MAGICALGRTNGVCYVGYRIAGFPVVSARNRAEQGVIRMEIEELIWDWAILVVFLAFALVLIEALLYNIEYDKKCLEKVKAMGKDGVDAEKNSEV
jgi:hypothetical protein